MIFVPLARVLTSRSQKTPTRGKPGPTPQIHLSRGAIHGNSTVSTATTARVYEDLHSTLREHLWIVQDRHLSETSGMVTNTRQISPTIHYPHRPGKGER